MDEKAIGEIKKFKKEMNKHIHADKVIFFGSRAGKKFRKDSDVDLIIVSEKFGGMNFFKRVAKMYDYWESNYPVDFICYTPEEFNKLKEEVSIVSEAVREGIEV